MNGNIYIFGGSGKKQQQDAAPVIFDTVYRFSPQTNSWSQVNTVSPVGLLGAASYSPDGKQILFFGGYNKALFDKYLFETSTLDASTHPEAWQKIVDQWRHWRISGTGTY